MDLEEQVTIKNMIVSLITSISFGYWVNSFSAGVFIMGLLIMWIEIES